METIAIVGVGLIGGSFGLAVRRAGFGGTILGVSSETTIRRALELGVIDQGVSLEEAAGRADLIYLAQPILSILETLGRIGPWVRPSALITDAGSTKARIMERARDTIRTGLFIGGHPMAGKESRGVEAAEAALFEGRPYALTPFTAGDLEDPRSRTLVGWLKSFGAKTAVLEPEEHDRTVAYISHLPQLLSTALAVTIPAEREALRLAGPAALDFTRLALSPFDVWRDILVTNAANIGEAIDCMTAKLQYMKDNLSSGAIEGEFRRAATFAEMLRQR